MVKENPKIPKIQHFKKTKAASMGMVDHTTLELTTLEEENKVRKKTQAMCNVLIVKSTIILQEDAAPTRKNLKKMKLELQDKSMMMRTHFW